MKKTILIISLLVFFQTTFCQVVEGDLEIFLDDIITNMPGSSGNDYKIPTNNELNTWNAILDNVFNNNLTAANSLANPLNYEIIEFLDTTMVSNNNFYIIEEILPKTKHWGTYVVNQNPLLNKLVLQAPHPKYEYNTGQQSAFCFKRLKAWALFVSGTHRCNHSQYSVCSGLTSVCSGSQEPYRISDNAHNTVSVFQRMTEIFFERSNQSIFVQMHGFTKLTSDPYVIMSNGTRVTPANDYIALIKEGLLQADASLTFKIAHIDLDWNRLIGFTNTQGRFINDSPSPCYQNATNSEGRFVHIELERYKLREDSVGWYKMFLALKHAFSDETSTVLVNNINVTSQGGATSITTNGGTLQMFAEVLPENATNSTVSWSVNNLSGQATISQSGLLGAVADGMVYAIATANDSSEISDSLLVTITGQSSGIDNYAENLIVKTYPNPASNQITIELIANETSVFNIGIYSLKGEIVFEQRLEKPRIGINSFVLDVSSLPSGLYIYKLFDNGVVTFSDKLVITGNNN